MDELRRNSAFCFMFCVSWMSSNRTFYFSLLGHETTTFPSKNNCWFSWFYFFLHNSFLISENLDDIPRVEVGWDLAETWTATGVTKAGWMALLQGAPSSTHQLCRLFFLCQWSKPEHLSKNSPLPPLFLVQRGYFTVYYQWRPQLAPVSRRTARHAELIAHTGTSTHGPWEC